VTDRRAEIRAFVDTYNREGVEAAIHVFDPGIHWASPPEWMDQSGYEGHDGLRDLDALWRQNFDEFGLTLREIHQVGDFWVVLLYQQGRIKGSGDCIDQKVAWVISYGDNGLITELRAYFSWEEAMEVAAAS
jgi:SnoaL-like domain